MPPAEFYRNRHFGSRCVLVANGPSLNTMDLSFLRDEIVIGLNKIYLGFKKFRFYPKYHVAVNLKVIEQGAKEINQLNCVRFIDSRALDLELLSPSPLTCFLTERCDLPFSTNLSWGYHQGCTVTHAALQIAYHLGFQTVIIIGLDHRYEYQGSPGEEQTLDGPDTNHFCENYFGHGQKWDNPHLADSEFYYARAREAFEADGRRIIDATQDGACPVFEKQNYKEIFALK